MQIELTVAIGLACSMLGIIFGVATQKRAERREASDEGKNNGIIISELGYLKAGNDDIKSKLNSMDGITRQLSIDMAEITQSTKSAHKRLDDHLKYDHKKDVAERSQ